MRHIMASAFLAILLTGCASGPTRYGPSQGGQNYGYQELKLENDRYRVTYTGSSDFEAQKYALFRAAELSLANGYDHFEVTSEHTDDGGAYGGGPVNTSIGFGVGSGGYRRGGPAFGFSLGLNDFGRAGGGRVTESLEIKMRNGTTGAKNVYDARAIVDSVRSGANP